MNAYLQCLGEEFNNCFQNEAGPDPYDETKDPCGTLRNSSFCKKLTMCAEETITEDCVHEEMSARIPKETFALGYALFFPSLE